jgi:hypothetical protein
VHFPGSWRKFLPSDLTSPWWYDHDALARLIFAHIGDAAAGGRDLTLREFVRQFRGLSGTAKAKAVCDRFPAIGRLSDIEMQPAVIAPLLEVMRAHSTAPSPAVLGLVGEDHFRARFEQYYGLTAAERFWYHKTSQLVDGLPVVCEVATGETKAQGHVYYGLNFSPTFDDPLAGTEFEVPKTDLPQYGLRGLLMQLHALPGSWGYTGYGGSINTAVAVHLGVPV